MMNEYRECRILVTPGNVADISMAMPLLAAVARTNRLIADKAYDADSPAQLNPSRQGCHSIYRNANTSLPARSRRLSTSQPY